MINTLETDMGIYVYPNPTTTILYLYKKDDAEININIIDNLGRVLISKTSKDLFTEINLSSFASGIYYLSINNGKQTATQKIVKQ